MHGNHICVTFHQITLVGLTNCIFCLIDTVKNFTLVVNLSFRTVDVFRLFLGLFLGQNTSAESNYFS